MATINMHAPELMSLAMRDLLEDIQAPRWRDADLFGARGQHLRRIGSSGWQRRIVGDELPRDRQDFGRHERLDVERGSKSRALRADRAGGNGVASDEGDRRAGARFVFAQP